MTSATKLSSSYLALVRRFPLIHIETHAQNEQALEMLSPLIDRANSGDLDRGEANYYLALVDLIHAFESRQFTLKPMQPVPLVKFLMKENNLRQADLIKEFGSRSLISDFLAGKRTLSKVQIERLAKRFSISPAAFFR